MKDFLKMWRLLWGIFMDTSMVIVCVILVYLMWTDRDIKNIHVACVVIAAIWSINDRSKPKPEGDQ